MMQLETVSFGRDKMNGVNTPQKILISENLLSRRVSGGHLFLGAGSNFGRETNSPEQMQAIDRILESRIQEKPTATTGPMLMGMPASGKFLGVSRATLWRMIKGGLLQKIENLPGTFRMRRADLEALAAGKRKLCCNGNDSGSQVR